MIRKFDFFKNKYGDELLIDLIRLESLEKYVYKHGPHQLSYYDITLLTEGAGFFHLNSEVIEIVPGKVLFSSPGQIRFWDIDLMPKGFVLIFEEAFLTCFLNDRDFVNKLRYFHCADSNCSLQLNPEELTYLHGLFAEIELEIDGFGRNDTDILKALLYKALIWFSRKYSGTEAARETNRYILNFEKLVREHFVRQHDVSFYAEKLHITCGYLNDLCKKFKGVNAKEYIQNQLIAEAKKLIVYSDLSISQIAENLRFEDVSYFIRKFKINTGLTPLAYRRKKP